VPPDPAALLARPPSRRGQTWNELCQAAGQPFTWLWHGYLAPGNVTLLTSPAKTGKTTLVAVLLARLKAGGTLAGLPLAAGRAALITEEGQLLWFRRGQKLAFDDHIRWFCRPFQGRPQPDEWQDLIDYLAELRARDGLDLVVIDPLASFLPSRDENSAAGMLDALAPLQRLTAAGVAVLLIHHPRRRDSAEGQAARGSGALLGFVDVVVEMHWFDRPAATERRRRLVAFSRHEETPPSLVIEWTADGTDYVAHGDAAAEHYRSGWDVLRAVLEDAPRKLTRQEVLEEWPPDHPRPDPATVWEWLERAVELGQVLRDGRGRKNDPYRYWLPGQEGKEHWRQSYFDQMREMQEEMRRDLWS
jgi:hypothetical protein